MKISEVVSESPNYQVEIREYLIIISLPEVINNNVLNFKSVFYNQFGDAEYLKSTPHITLNHFLIESVPEETIQKELQQLLSNWIKFDVCISGFGEFSGSRTIFLNTSTEDIIKLQNHLRTVLRQRVKIAKKYTQPIRKPHITIASAIPIDQFDECWDYYKNKTYSNNFSVDRINVLCRRYSQNKTPYKKAFEIRLKK